MHGLSLTITDDATPRLLQLEGALLRPDIRRVMGRGVANALRGHFKRLDSERANALGGTRTHFYSQVGKSVQQPELAGEGGVKVSINHIGIAQRFFGGTIRPAKKKWIAVPARAEAHGKRPEEFNDLHFVLIRSDLAALVQNYQTLLGGGRRRGSITPAGGRKGQATGGGVFWWLKKEVRQAPDPSVLPPESELLEAAMSAGNGHMRTLIERKLSK